MFFSFLIKCFGDILFPSLIVILHVRKVFKVKRKLTNLIERYLTRDQKYLIEDNWNKIIVIKNDQFASRSWKIIYKGFSVFCDERNSHAAFVWIKLKTFVWTQKREKICCINIARLFDRHYTTWRLIDFDLSGFGGLDLRKDGKRKLNKILTAAVGKKTK